MSGPGGDADLLDVPDEPERGLGRLLRRVPSTVRPVLTTCWTAARRPSLVVLLGQLAAGALGATGLVATQDVFGALLDAGDAADRVLAALPAVALVAALYTARGAAQAVGTFAQARIGPAVRRLAEERLLAAALATELAAYDDPAFHDRLHRARDRGLIQLELATATVAGLLGALLAVAGAGGAMGVLHPLLLPVLVLSVLPEAWAVLAAAQLRYASLVRMVPLDRRVLMIGDLATRHESAAEVRACQAAPFVLGEYRGTADRLRDEAIRVGVAGARTQAAGRAVSGLGAAATFGVLLLLVHAGLVPLASAGAAVVAIGAARAALGQLVRSANQLAEQGMYIADLDAFLADAATRTRAGRTRPVPSAPTEIALRGVGFRYPGAAADTLREVTLTLRRGESVALVGENGSGKTTLARLVAGLYEPTAGTITWDGVDARELDPDALADRVMMVQQHPVRWPYDARANVRVGRHDRRDPGDAALREAAALARADEVVAGLLRGWDTVLSRYFRGGHELSGGQWQRLAVARGLFRDAPLLIWDEPTAPLDPAAEYAVYESLRLLARGRTVVLVTHRLASVRHVDRVYLLHEGRVAEQGTHRELLAAGGRYARLYELQSRLYGVEAEWSSRPG
ncbi:MAG TPA: ABC transporter ATP-binding protein [Pseudonocardiaceae bacterium]